MSLELQTIFAPIVGEAPWRVRLGHGSFLTFEFGPRVKKNNHFFGAWHLWIQNCDWQIRNGEMKAHSELPHFRLDAIVRNFEGRPFKGVELDSQINSIVFVFSPQVRLICSPYADAQNGEELWSFFRPDGSVISVTADGEVRIEPVRRLRKRPVTTK